MMNWRKLNRILHRDIGYLIVGMTVIYAVSGIVLNHRKKSGDASFSIKTTEFNVNAPVQREKVNNSYISQLVKDLNEASFKGHYFPSENLLMVYLDGGHIQLNLETGSGEMIKLRKRPVLWEFNFLHYNKPKRLWTWISDVFAVSMILIAVTGLFMIKGKKGITGRGAVLTLIGILIPLSFLIIYLWAV